MGKSETHGLILNGLILTVCAHWTEDFKLFTKQASYYQTNYPQDIYTS